MAPGKSRECCPIGFKYRRDGRSLCSPCSSCGCRRPAAGASACPRVYLTTRHLFDGRVEMAADSVEDPFCVLPDDLLRRVLSFLPDDDALQTCVLDTRWRDLWRGRTSLLLGFGKSSRSPSCESFKQLVKLFISLRGDSPLYKCDAYPDEVKNGEWPYTYTKMLMEYALTCQTKELTVSCSAVGCMDDRLVFDAPLISQHLKTIHLGLVKLEQSSLNFSRCPVLEDLEVQFCKIHARRISSKSLKRLRITDLSSFPEHAHTRIFAPALIELLLDCIQGLPPFLEYMPFLVTANIWLVFASTDFCRENHDCGCHAAYPVQEGLFLNGLSNAVNLKLIAEPEMVICHCDLEWCPIFDKLKTLFLNEWFRAVDLVCVLQHSPILERLTIQIGNRENLIGATGVQETIEQSFLCAHLKVVNIECSKMDDGILTILKILRTFGIPRHCISIKAPSPPSDWFSSRKGLAAVLGSTPSSFHHYDGN